MRNLAKHSTAIEVMRMANLESLRACDEPLNKAIDVLFDPNSTDTDRENARFVINSMTNEKKEIRKEHNNTVMKLAVVGAICLVIVLTVKRGL